MIHKSFLTLALLVAAASAASQPSETHAPDGWSKVSRANGNENITLEFGLRQGALDEIISSLEHFSDPDSIHYGSQLSHNAVQMLITPTGDTISAFEKWVLDSGIDTSALEWSSASDWVKIKLSVAEAEQLLGTEYFHYSHESGLDALLAPDYLIPKRLKEHIDTIQPTTLFPTLANSKIEVKPGKGPNRRVNGVCGATADVECLKALYNINRYIDDDTTGAPGNEYSVVVFAPDSASVKDFQTFLGSSVPVIPWAGQTYFYPFSVNGGQLATPYSSLGSVSAQYSGALTFPIYERVLAVAKSATAGTKDWLGFINHALSTRTLSPTIIIPYSDPEHLIPEDVARRVCDGFAALGARGVSVIVASGDDGVGSSCSTTQYVPQFPASCPYVTAVGGTRSSNIGGSLESAADFSGGGFSRYFAQPGYQKPAVDGYFVQKTVGAGKINRNGRAYPDVSAFAINYKHILNGGETQLSSTGAAAITFGSVITILNDALVQAGKPTLGFLNRRIYGQWKDLLTDVLDGKNTGCQASDGFEAAEGWDPVTGYGTPNYAALFESLGL